MIIGTLMALKTCLILGQVSHNLLYWMKKLLTDICGPVGVMEVNGKERQAEGKAKMV